MLRRRFRACLCKTRYAEFSEPSKDFFLGIEARPQVPIVAVCTRDLLLIHLFAVSVYGPLDGPFTLVWVHFVSHFSVS